MRRLGFALLWLFLLAGAEGFRLGLALEGQLLPLGLAAFAEVRSGSGLLRAELGHDYLGPYALTELGWVLAEDPWSRSWVSLGGGDYLWNEADPGRGALPFLLLGSGYADALQGVGVWAGAMLPLKLLRGEAPELGSGGGLALLALVRVRVEVAELALR